MSDETRKMPERVFIDKAMKAWTWTQLLPESKADGREEYWRADLVIDRAELRGLVQEYLNMSDARADWARRTEAENARRDEAGYRRACIEILNLLSTEETK